MPKLKKNVVILLKINVYFIVLVRAQATVNLFLIAGVQCSVILLWHPRGIPKKRAFFFAAL